MKYARRLLDDKRLFAQWIDPRLSSIRVGAVETYLQSRGWQKLEPDRPNTLVYAEPSSEGMPLVQFIPDDETFADYAQRMLEVIAGIAIYEKRSAPEVLTDILACGNAQVARNGFPNALTATVAS